MEEDWFEGQGRIAVRVGSKRLSVAPGSGVSLPIVLLNQGSATDFFELSVGGIPSTWVSVPSPIIRLAPGGQREVTLVIQPPALPQGRAGRFPLIIQVTTHESPEERLKVEVTLTVAALEVAGRVGALLPATEFPVIPGEGTTIHLVLLNQGLEPDTFQLAVDGIPVDWVSTPTARTSLLPGQQLEVPLTIHPPRLPQSRAGRHPFRIRVISQVNPQQVAEAACTLSVATFSQFSTELQPSQIEAQQAARVAVRNQGNIQQAFTLSWQSLNDELTFEPGPHQELRVPSGQVAMAEFRASPRRRPLIGAAAILPFTTRVQSVDREKQDLRGEVVSRALIPSWVFAPLLVLILAIACGSLYVLLGGTVPWLTPAEPAISQPTREGDTPVPAEMLPTDMPPDGATEEPTVEPATEPSVEPPAEPTSEPPIAPTEETGGETGQLLPCLPPVYAAEGCCQVA